MIHHVKVTIMIISKDLQYRPIIMIRFNPHDYKLENGKKSSPWTTNKLGICVINKDLEFGWNKRLKILSNTIEYYLYVSIILGISLLAGIIQSFIVKPFSIKSVI